MGSEMTSPRTGIYRLRKSFFGKCILQERLTFPCLIGGRVDASVREIVWEDVEYKRAPAELTQWIKLKETQPQQKD